MQITQKDKYAIRAIFELARRRGEGPVKAAEIADKQKIPFRFLEVILSQLKRGGMVRSKRGFFGGYTLNRSPEQITVADILRHMEKPATSLHCIPCVSKNDCELMGNCAFMPMWEKAQKAMLDVLDRTTIQDLIDNSEADGPPPLAHPSEPRRSL